LRVSVDTSILIDIFKSVMPAASPLRPEPPKAGSQKNACLKELLR
jgi:hypothetical protein